MITLPPFPDVFGQMSSASLERLAFALRRYQSWGAQFVSLPWCAPMQYVQATRPPSAIGLDVTTPYGQLVASGEQSFLWLAEHDELPEPKPQPHHVVSIMAHPMMMPPPTPIVVPDDDPLRDWWIGWTPCFRDDPPDELHHYGFIKAELFAWVSGWHPDRDHLTGVLCLNQIRTITRLAKTVFDELLGAQFPNDPPTVKILSVTPERPDDVLCLDIVCEGVELGSYGVRRHPVLNRPYIFATGLAEPRLQALIRRLEAGLKEKDDNKIV